MEMEPTERDSDVGDDSPFQPPRWPSHPLLEAYRSATPQNGGSIPHRVPLLASCHVEAIIGNGHTNGEDSNIDDQSAPSPRNESSFQPSVTPTRNQSTYQQSNTGSPSFRGINGVAERVEHLAIRRPSSPERPNENDDDSDEDEDSEEARKLAEEQLDVMARLQMQVRGIRVPEHFDANSIIASLQQRPFDYPIPNAVNFGQLAQQQAGTSSAPPHLPSALTSTSHAGIPATQNGQNGQTGPDNSPRSSDGGSGNSANFAYEEQFRQLYEIDSNPVRREFLDDLFTYMHKRGTPINRLPIMAKHVLDLFQLYNLVVERGGLVEVINKKLWQEIIKGLNLPSSITSAAFTLRTQYMKYLYNYETEKKKFSTFSELQVAIDGNRREGRRATYYDHRATSSNPPTPQQQLTNARLSQLANSAMNLHNGHGIQAPPMPNPQMNGTAVLQAAIGNELQQSINMMDYFKMFQNVSMPTSVAAAMPTPGGLNVAATLWNSVYNNNPNQHQPPQIHHQIPEQREPINLANPDTNTDSFADATPNSSRRKRSRRSPYDRSDNSNDSATAARRRRSPSVSPPPAQRPAPFATSIRIETRGDARNGEGSLVVTMEVGGQTYQGVLFSQQNESGESRNSPRNSMP